MEQRNDQCLWQKAAGKKELAAKLGEKIPLFSLETISISVSMKAASFKA